MRRADAYFDKVEADASEHSAARMIVQNPATRATMKTMQVRICSTISDSEIVESLTFHVLARF